MARLIIVSNRLPVSLHIKDDGSFLLTQNVGGLATAIGPYHKSHSDCLWVGWSGIEKEGLDEGQLAAITKEFKSRRCVPIHLTRDEVDGYYGGFSNDTLWPLFHDFSHEAKFSPETWKMYQRVNEIFCDVISKSVRPGDMVWIQDYHLMLLPALLRSRFPDLRIGWFLHIPFPSTEIFRSLPQGADLLRGLLGADLLGFHTVDFCNNFLASVKLLLGLDTDDDGRVALADGRHVTVDAFPIGIDYNLYKRTSHSRLAQGMRHGIEAASGKRTRRIISSLSAESRAAVEAEQKEGSWWSHRSDEELSELSLLRPVVSSNPKPNKIVVSVDRLDYTKGLPERIKSFGRMLEKYPEWVGHVTYYLLATPSRENVESYRLLKKQVDQLVGEVNGKYSLLSWTPIHYITRSLPIKPVCGIYTAGDVALVTPLRDGMNLVAKEYLSCHDGRDGSLVLSDMCGAARELTDAFIVNPYDIEAVCDALHSALEIDSAEAIHRNRRMQARLEYSTASLWCGQFISALRQASTDGLSSGRLCTAKRDELVEQWGNAKHKLVLCDYDGTLTPIVRTPDRAHPTKRLLDLLKRLGSMPGVDFAIVSGRNRKTMQDWFGDLPVRLVAEHGAWSSPNPSSSVQHEGNSGIQRHDGSQDRSWYQAPGLPDPDVWHPVIEEIMDESVARVPRSFVERKSNTMAWHYRMSDQHLAFKECDRLLHRLHEVCSQYGLMTMENSKVIEVCPVSIGKGMAVSPLVNSGDYDFVLALGDDITDETMFAVVPERLPDHRQDSGSSETNLQDGDAEAGVNEADALVGNGPDGRDSRSHPAANQENGPSSSSRNEVDNDNGTGWTVKVGVGMTKARYRVGDYGDTVRLLGYLAAESKARMQ
ncbi:bifunctional alpha,alpha-trehalose-phosphate synthase (UDP-forming)/trehalose-phosphatase [Bifidobacterium bombi]|uniref:Trehalose-phosphatase n=1 Tax=Bifidobacterium bombi DSM 19703 TaxID=1341695 RepID=A0A086BPF6_9BIFI|nr:bifunctional alpha,alpha-trehalose-phosphate synthase (UDP-forming)/trehalose-phosphatase [Bifidobacterium bombi]KFF31820.1 trehalose-phosphatase [Bifidobacterium bombi DSM 19703]